MIELPLLSYPKALRSVLCLGAHCDDIEIGAGGTILQLAEQQPDAAFYWVVFSSSKARALEARRSAAKFTAKRNSTVVILDFKNSYFPFIGAEIKDYFEQLKQKVSPDLIFTHYRDDLHQDHRLISQLTWNTFRDHFVLEYEIPKYDGDVISPNVFVPLDEQRSNEKVNNIYECFKTQRDKSWFKTENFLSLMRLRAIECNASEGYAEAFYSRKIVLGVGRGSR